MASQHSRIHRGDKRAAFKIPYPPHSLTLSALDGYIAFLLKVNIEDQTRSGTEHFNMLTKRQTFVEGDDDDVDLVNRKKCDE